MVGGRKLPEGPSLQGRAGSQVARPLAVVRVSGKGTPEQPLTCLSCSEFYEPEALMMEEEGMVIVGLLVGLNVLDANLCLKGEDLDSQVLWDLGFDGMNQTRNF